ncbi:MAG: NAD(P)/FAD-dependent oxidoreductase [Gemmatimonadaceae bacterium]
MSDAQVLIVGAGPAGSATAWALARSGTDVLLLDRARFPRDKTCAEYLSPQASRILFDMGALDACERAGAAHLAGMLVRAPGGATLRGDFVAAHGFRGFRDRGLALRRTVLDNILLGRARAAGARVLEGARVSDVTRDARGRVSGVRLIPENGGAAELRAAIVVGADGLRSIVARRLSLAHRARLPRRLAFVAHFEGIGDVGAYGEMHVERDGYVGLANVGHGLTNVALVVPHARAREVSGDAARFLDSWIRRRPHLAPRFTRAARVTPVRATGPFAARARRSWVPGAALVGDAADFFDPFTGEGIYNALRGGELLGESLLPALVDGSPRSLDSALATYDRARRREFAAKSRVERLLGVAVSFPPLMDRLTSALARHKDMADLLVGVAGDFIPAREVLSARFVTRLLLAALGAPERDRVRHPAKAPSAPARR